MASNIGAATTGAGAAGAGAGAGAAAAATTASTGITGALAAMGPVGWISAALLAADLF